AIPETCPAGEAKNPKNKPHPPRRKTPTANRTHRSTANRTYRNPSLPNHAKGGKSGGNAVGDEGFEGCGVDVLLDGVGEVVEHGFAALGEAGGVGGLPVHSGLGGGFGEPGSAEGVVLEDAVPHGAPYGAGAESVEEGFGVVVGVVVGDAVVDLVAVDVVVAPAGRRGGEGLVLVEGDGRGQELEAGGGVGGGFDAVGDGAAEHLVTAADAEYGPAVF